MFNSGKMLALLLLSTLGVALFGLHNGALSASSGCAACDAARSPVVAPAAADSGFRFAVIGDYGKDSPGEKRVAALVAGWNPSFVITAGDNNYPGGASTTIDRNIGKYYRQFIGNYQGRFGAGSATNRFWPSLGNHDWGAIRCSGGSCTGPYLSYFTLPGNERYYDVELGPVHLFVLDSDPKEPDGITVGSVQANWLQGRLAASTSCFDVVLFHHAPYTSGQHRSDTDMRWPFAAWGADVVITGHDHTYERLDVAGTPYYVVGLGGASKYQFGNLGVMPPGVASLARYNAKYGAMLVTVDATGWTSQFIDIAGTLIDTYTLPKDCAAPTGG